MKHLFVILFCAFTLENWSQTKYSEHTYTLGENDKSPEASIQQASWLAGSWRGLGFGGTVEEIWTFPQSGHMIGAFRLIKEDQNVFFEFVNLAEKDGSLVMHVKHYNEDLTGWEEKDQYVSFPLVRIAPNELNFDGLTYKLAGPNELLVYVIISEGDETEEAYLTLKRMTP